MDSFRMKIATPESSVFDGPIESLMAPGVDGSFGVLAHHAPMIAAIRDGVLKASVAGEDVFFAVGKGVLEVTGDLVLVLTGKAVRSADREGLTAMDDAAAITK